MLEVGACLVVVVGQVDHTPTSGDLVAEGRRNTEERRQLAVGSCLDATWNENDDGHGASVAEGCTYGLEAEELGSHRAYEDHTRRQFRHQAWYPVGIQRQVDVKDIVAQVQVHVHRRVTKRLVMGLEEEMT